MFSHPQIPFVLRVQQVSDSLTINLHVTHLKTGIGKDHLMVVKASSLWKLCSAGRNSHHPLQESCECLSLTVRGKGRKEEESQGINAARVNMSYRPSTHV